MNAQLSSARHDWATPAAFFDAVNAGFRFTLDAAAHPDTAKCAACFTPDQDALSQPWPGRVWLNPPYGKHQKSFVVRAAQQVADGVSELVAILIPARPDTKLWQDLILPSARAVCFVRGRLRFNEADPAPFPSAITVFAARALTAAELATLHQQGYTVTTEAQATQPPKDISPNQLRLALSP